MTRPDESADPRADLAAATRTAEAIEAQRVRDRMDPRQYDDGELALNFPHRVWGAQQPLSRVHRTVNGPVYFSVDGTGRFDPPDSDAEFGTWYLSSHPAGAFVEVFGRTRTIRVQDINDRVMSQVYLPSDVRLADFTHPSIVGLYGITAELSTGNPDHIYSITQQWAKALYRVGFAGVYYLARHDVEAATRSIAIFGKPGDESFADSVATSAEPLDAIVDEMIEHFQFRVVSGRPL